MEVIPEHPSISPILTSNSNMDKESMLVNDSDDDNAEIVINLLY